VRARVSDTLRAMGMSAAIGVLTLTSFAAIAESGSVPSSVGARDSLCVRMTGTLEGEHVTLAHRYELGGVLPATICDLEPRVRYRFTLDGGGLERRIGAFTMSGEGRAALHGVQFSAVARNIVLPGWGSVYARRAGAGLSDDISLGATLAVLYQEEMEYLHLRNRLAVQEERLGAAAAYEDRTRFQVASEMPFAIAVARKPSRHRSKPSGAAASAPRGDASRAPAARPDLSRVRRVGRFRESGCFIGAV